MSGRYFEDLAVGQPFGSGRLRVDKEQIKDFDSQPFHLDEDAALHTIFGRVGGKRLACLRPA